MGNREIMFCVGEVGFTWFSLPIYSGWILYNIYGVLTSRWKDPEDPWEPLNFFGIQLSCATIRQKWLVSQALDLFTDIMTFVHDSRVEMHSKLLRLRSFVSVRRSIGK